jgi:hypothetical protein
MEQVIIQWKLNRVVLASKMQMPKETFNQKLHGKRNSFTNQERMKLRNVLIKLLIELDNATDIKDFNDALRTVLEVEV